MDTTHLPATSRSDNGPSAESHNARVIKIPDLPTFYADTTKDKISYEDWHLQMRSKMSVNKLSMLIEAAKKKHTYRALQETMPLRKAAFGNANEKQDNRTRM